VKEQMASKLAPYSQKQIEGHGVKRGLWITALTDIYAVVL
jgi:hypothetical protein